MLVHYVRYLGHSFGVFSGLILKSRWFIVNIVGVLVQCLGISTLEVHFFPPWNRWVNRTSHLRIKMVSKVLAWTSFSRLRLGCGHEVATGLLLQISLLELGMVFLID